jgi:hypothetical protein
MPLFGEHAAEQLGQLRIIFDDEHFHEDGRPA